MLRYRFGVSLSSDGLRKAMGIADNSISEIGAGLDLQELLVVCKKHEVPLSRAEVVSLFMKLSSGSPQLLTSETILELADAVGKDEKLPPEMALAREALAAAGREARSKVGGMPLSKALAKLGKPGSVSAVEASILRTVLAPFSLSADDEARWATLLLALDKDDDGAVLLEPLVQWSAGLGGGDGEEVMVLEPPPRLSDEELRALSPRVPPESNSSSEGDGCDADMSRVDLSPTKGRRLGLITEEFSSDST